MSALVVVGDLMLDVDIDGSAQRLSPEAPVPVVEPERVWHRPGGAGLAAVLAARAHPDVVLVTATGDDPSGRALARLFAAEHPQIRVIGLPLTGTTLAKVRIRAAGQSVVRVDHGDGYAADEPLPAQARDALRAAAAICVADYGHGVAAHQELRALLIELAADIPVVWDPHPRGGPPIPGATLVTPNSAEAQRFSPDTASPGHRAEALRRQWGARAVSVTLGSRGAVVADPDAVNHIPPPEVAADGRADTCGAGDRFAVAAALALADGDDPLRAATRAVDAASRFVASGGAAGVSSPADLPGFGVPRPDTAVTGMPAVLELAERVRKRGGTLVAAGGCFDLLHTGHIRLLRRARALGDALVVLINSDDSVRALKGEGRPVVSEDDRARVLGALGCVDGVAIFTESSPAAALEALRPDIWVKGGDYSGVTLPEAEVVQRHGGDVVVLPTVPGYSTSQLIAAAR
ncbi:PfkB family carbohydrate kinase [Mycobacterium sp. MYCO198283]|uniref:PfkB family carbohydrate kinase n=1 Tax=Mycobacterium sp. MYCO198283 TaxID=2883505 RepID=UPI001E36607A|nr:PfkB family carbohydrate kinase [Mycobacterium sp. MYCO198283]MCG5431674.1 PfkB family carbohydrate kinase [Mycobacterium sp. MYCO198283]